MRLSGRESYFERESAVGVHCCGGGADQPVHLCQPNLARWGILATAAVALLPPVCAATNPDIHPQCCRMQFKLKLKPVPTSISGCTPTTQSIGKRKQNKTKRERKRERKKLAYGVSY
jgi:hypothetical protein